MILVFTAIAGCSLAALVIFLIAPPFWSETVGPKLAAYAAILSFAVVMWVASQLMRLADWLLEAPL